MDIPKWENMPEPQALLTKSWEDFYPEAYAITQANWKRDPTPHELKDIFEECDDFDCESGTYWTTVEYAVERYYNTNCSVCGKEDCECEE